MIGQLNPNNKAVTVVGGGLFGMFAAYRLNKLDYEVTLREASNRLGGLVQTRSTSLGLSEAAANSLVATSALRELCAEVGVTLIPLNSAARKKFIFRDGAMRRLPLSWTGLFSAVMRAFVVPAKRSYASMFEFADYHLGDEARRYLIEPMLTGIYGASSLELSPEAAFASMVPPPGKSLGRHLLLGKPVSRTQGEEARRDKREIVAVDGGMQILVDRLGDHLLQKLGPRLRLSDPVTSLPADENVLLCVTAHSAASLLAPYDEELSLALSKVVYTPLVSATVFCKRLGNEPAGLGVLIPPCEQRGVSGILFSSSSFADRTASQDICSFTVLLGGTKFPEFIQHSEADMQNLIDGEFYRILGRRMQIEQIQWWRQPQAIPIYSSHLAKSWEIARKGWCSKPGHVIFGNYSGQVSLRGGLGSLAALAPRSFIKT